MFYKITYFLSIVSLFCSLYLLKIGYYNADLFFVLCVIHCIYLGIAGIDLFSNVSKYKEKCDKLQRELNLMQHLKNFHTNLTDMYNLYKGESKRSDNLISILNTLQKTINENTEVLTKFMKKHQ